MGESALIVYLNSFIFIGHSVVSRYEALKRARSLELDLVEVNLFHLNLDICCYDMLS